MSRLIAPVKRVVRALVRRGLAIAPVRRLVEGELARTRPGALAAPPTALPAFTDRHGTTHQLDASLRDTLKPSWREMLDPDASATSLTDDALRARVRKAAKAVTELERVLGATAGVTVTGSVLEVGCYDGSAAFELSRRTGTRVIASDMARYHVVQRPGEPEDEAVANEAVALAALRERARITAGVAPGSVEFVEDDITVSALEPGSFDLIVSFEVLEHLARPGDAFAAMARLLRPGGVMYHDYNPFFSANGGHSLATLDLPWGQARLDGADVERYLRELRPAEADQALRFYRDSLNRMTRADLEVAITAAGLELLVVVPWHQRNLLPGISQQVYREVQRNYPGVTIGDLLATFVTVVARRPDAAPSPTS
jgi:SAM-dependent methyltransferase